MASRPHTPLNVPQQDIPWQTMFPWWGYPPSPFSPDKTSVNPPDADPRLIYPPMYPPYIDPRLMAIHTNYMDALAMHMKAMHMNPQFPGPATPHSTGHGSPAQSSSPSVPGDDEDYRQPVKGSDANDADRQYEALKDGFLLTKKKELTVLLVGETGVGKTAFLSLVVNILEGRNSSNYRITHDVENEAGGLKQGSQTNSARLYEFASVNGVKIRLLDTPGLADTRGIDYDTHHKADIARAIQDTIPAIDGVLIIANGTTERLQVATDYAITTLSAIFPRSIASNISLLFTMISNPMAFNFQMESLPDCLQEAETFNLDNPISLRKKYEEIRDKPKYAKQAKAMEKMVDDAHNTAVEMLAEFFNWLDRRQVQPTTTIVDLYHSVCEIDRKIQNALSRMNSVAEKKRDMEKLKDSMSQSEQSMKIYEKFETIMNRTIKVQNDTTHHNTLCGHPNCYSNCHVDCSLNFSLDPANLTGCAAFGYYQSKCVKCGHPVVDHHHYHSIWEDKVDTQVTVDEDAKKKFEDASKDKSKYQDSVNNVEKAIHDLDDEIANITQEVGVLCQMYKQLSLSGSFAGQITKSIRLFELNLETLRSNGADDKAIQSVSDNIQAMRMKEEVVKNAGEAMKRKVHVVVSQPAKLKQWIGNMSSRLFSK